MTASMKRGLVWSVAAIAVVAAVAWSLRPRPVAIDVAEVRHDRPGDYQTLMRVSVTTENRERDVAGTRDDRVGHLVQELLALLARHVLPLLARRFRRLARRIDVVGIAGRHATDHRVVGGRDTLEGLSGATGIPCRAVATGRRPSSPLCDD